MKFRPVSRAIPMFLLVFWVIFPAAAEEVYHSSEFWALHPPTTWDLQDSSPGYTAFQDMNRRAILQIYTTQVGAYTSSRQFVDTIRQALGARGESTTFTWFSPGYLAGRADGFTSEAAIAEFSWNAGSFRARGYGIFLIGGAQRSSYLVLSFSQESEFQTYLPFIFSGLDSFQPWMDAESDYVGTPGPISQFYASPRDTALADLAAEGGQAFIDALDARAEASELTIAREAIILSQYQSAPEEVQLDAWRRFYQIIFRDSYADLGPMAKSLIDRFQPGSTSQLAESLLAMLQDFEYRRTGTLSDLDATQRVLLDGAGDCDSLVLTYLQLLSHSGIDGVIMINPSKAHSVAGVGSGVRSSNPQANARIAGNGQNWLVAELTDKVDLGLIARDMASPDQWMAFDLRFSAN